MANSKHFSVVITNFWVIVWYLWWIIFLKYLLPFLLPMWIFSYKFFIWKSLSTPVIWQKPCVTIRSGPCQLLENYILAHDKNLQRFFMVHFLHSYVRRMCTFSMYASSALLFVQTNKCQMQYSHTERPLPYLLPIQRDQLHKHGFDACHVIWDKRWRIIVKIVVNSALCIGSDYVLKIFWRRSSNYVGHMAEYCHTRFAQPC